MDGIFDCRLPQPALRAYVRMLKIVGCSFPASMTVLPVKTYWPRAENCLTFFPKDLESITFSAQNNVPERNARSSLHGQPTLMTNRHVGRDFMIVQVQFQPGALHRLTGLPNHELTDRFVDAEAVFSAEISRVNERLSYCNHYTAMIPIVETFLLQLVSRARQTYLRPIDRATLYLLDHPGMVSMDWLADQACLSSRQFHRLFVEREGVGPKLYARIARFEKAVKLKNAQPHKDWLGVALDLGYHDYQHLVRDFKAFTALTPPEFLIREGRSPERAFGKAET